jgi:hypothetical protein
MVDKLGLARKLPTVATKMAEWCERHKDTEYVLNWIKANPVPANWQGSPMEWAFTEMPVKGVE